MNIILLMMHIRLNKLYSVYSDVCGFVFILHASEEFME